jgi:hypothetical protein
VVVWITNGNAPSKASFPYSSLVVKDIDGEVSIKVLLDRASNWNTSVGVNLRRQIQSSMIKVVARFILTKR